MRQLLQPKTNILLCQFENLTRASVPVGGFSKWKSQLFFVPLFPKIRETILEKLRRDFWFLLLTKCIDWLPATARRVNFAIANLQEKFQLYQRAVEIILLDLTLTAARWHIRMHKGFKMLAYSGSRQLLILLGRLFFQLCNNDARDNFRFGAIQQIIPR